MRRWSAILLVAVVGVACGGEAGPSMDEIFPDAPGVVESASAKAAAVDTIGDSAAVSSIAEMRTELPSPSLIDGFSDLELLAYAYDLIWRADAGAGFDLVETEPERLARLGLDFEGSGEVVYFLLEQSAGRLRPVALHSVGGAELACDNPRYLHIDLGIDEEAASTPLEAVKQSPVGWMGTAHKVADFGSESLWVIRDGERVIARVTVGSLRGGFWAGEIERCP